MNDLRGEITEELMRDLAKAIRDVMTAAVPSLPIEVRLEPAHGGRGPRIVVEARADEGDPVYGHIIKAKGRISTTQERVNMLTSSNEGRRLLGLPEREGL